MFTIELLLNLKIHLLLVTQEKKQNMNQLVTLQEYYKVDKLSTRRTLIMDNISIIQECPSQKY